MLSEQIKSLVERIDISKRKIGRSAYSSADNYCEKSFFEWTEKLFPGVKSDLSGYIAFSKIANGLNYNGLFVYSIIPGDKYNIYNSNEEWWDVGNQRKYLFFADDSISWYCLDVSSGIFNVLDKPGGEEMEQYCSFDELLSCALEASL